MEAPGPWSMFPSPISLHLQNTNSKIEVLRMSTQALQSIKPQVGSSEHRMLYNCLMSLMVFGMKSFQEKQRGRIILWFLAILVWNQT